MHYPGTKQEYLFTQSVSAESNFEISITYSRKQDYCVSWGGCQSLSAQTIGTKICQAV